MPNRKSRHKRWAQFERNKRRARSNRWVRGARKLKAAASREPALEAMTNWRAVRYWRACAALARETGEWPSAATRARLLALWRDAARPAKGAHQEGGDQ